MAKPISTTIRVTDHASGALQNISKNLGKCINGFMRLNQVSSTGINVGAMTNCDTTLESINDNVEQIRKSMESASTASTGLDNNISNAHKSSSNLLSTMKKVAATYLTLQAAGSVVGTSDMLAQAKQRLSLTLREGETIDEINKKIMASANSARASYSDTLNQVSKLAMNAGKSFESTDQITKFVEQFNKLGAMGGASVYESSQAMYQLTQSMAKGKLDGDELRSVMEGMPLVAQEIAEYLGTDVGTMKEFAAEGKVTAEVVRNALLGSAKETDEVFKNMPRTWAQNWQVFKNNAIKAFKPVLDKINEIANNKEVQEFIGGLSVAMSMMAETIVFIMDKIGGVFSFISDNWNAVQPILLTGLAILGSYITFIGLYNLVTGIAAGIAGVAAASESLRAGATFTAAAGAAAAAGAQSGLNAALLACPYTWIIVLIIALIAAFIVLWDTCEGYRKFVTDMWNDNAKAMGGFYNDAVVPICNGYIDMTNKINDGTKEVAKAMVNAWADAATFVVENFGFIADAIKANLSIYNKVASFFGQKTIDLDFAVSSEGIEALRKQSLMNIDKLSVPMERLEPLDLEEYNKNVDAITDKLSNTTFSGVFSDLWNQFTGNTEGEGDIPPYEVPDYSETLGGIEDNTGETAKSVDISQEDLKYLRDIAEQEVINRFTTAEIKVDMKNNNNISSNMDLDGVVDHLATRITETMDAVAAGAY